MNYFEEIDKLKEDLPRIKAIKNSAKNIKLNFYQKFAVVTYIICFILGIVLGNLFPTCSSSVTLLDNSCSTTQFNFFLMILFWFGSLIFCVLFYAIGRIITLLDKLLSK